MKDEGEVLRWSIISDVFADVQWLVYLCCCAHLVGFSELTSEEVVDMSVGIRRSGVSNVASSFGTSRKYQSSDSCKTQRLNISSDVWFCCLKRTSYPGNFWQRVMVRHAGHLYAPRKSSSSSPHHNILIAEPAHNGRSDGTEPV